MKRRGFTPNIRTYATMLNGLARIDDWHTHSKQLENAHSLFQSYQEYVHGIKAEYPGSRDINVVPWNSYMFILGRAGLHQKLFDTYYLFDNEGPLTPDQYTYTTMFTTLFDRRDTGEIGEGPRAQNASDAKVLWRRMLKDSERLNFPIDSPVIASVLRVLNRGRPSDQLLAFDIVREYLGFCKPGEPPTEPKVPLNLILFQIVLELCNYSRKFRLCIHWTQLIMDKAMDPRSPESEILARSHMEQMFTAYASMAAMGSLNESEQALEALQWMIKESVIGSKPPGQLKPSLHTFGLVMMACWRCGDWASASRTFELVTGLSAESFKDGGNYNPHMKLGGQGLTPNSVVTSSMVRAAVASGDLANMRQCLRMVSYYGEEAIFSIGKDLLTDQSKRHTKRLKKDHVFYNTKLAYALVDCVNQVIPKSNAEEPEEEEGNSSIDAEEKEQWLALRSKAKEIAKGDPRTGYVPGLEQQILGSARGLAATDSRIDFTMMSRTGRGQNRRM